jgi:hypothetical protein
MRHPRRICLLRLMERFAFILLLVNIAIYLISLYNLFFLMFNYLIIFAEDYSY